MNSDESFFGFHSFNLLVYKCMLFEGTHHVIQSSLLELIFPN